MVIQDISESGFFPDAETCVGSGRRFSLARALRTEEEEASDLREGNLSFFGVSEEGPGNSSSREGTNKSVYVCARWGQRCCCSYSMPVLLCVTCYRNALFC